MKFKVAVIAILVAILGVTTAGTVLVVQEAREQTRIAQNTAELNLIQATFISRKIANDSTLEEFNLLMNDISKMAEIGESINSDLWSSLKDAD